MEVREGEGNSVRMEMGFQRTKRSSVLAYLKRPGHALASVSSFVGRRQTCLGVARLSRAQLLSGIELTCKQRVA